MRKEKGKKIRTMNVCVCFHRMLYAHYFPPHGATTPFCADSYYRYRCIHHTHTHTQREKSKGERGREKMKENRLPVDNFRRNKMAVKVCVCLAGR